MSDETRKLTDDETTSYTIQTNPETEQESSHTKKLTDDEINRNFGKRCGGNPANIRYACFYVGRLANILSGEDLSDWLKAESIRAGIGFVEAASQEYVVPLAVCKNNNVLYTAGGFHPTSRSKKIDSEYVPASTAEERCALAPYCKFKNMGNVPQGSDWRRDTLLPPSSYNGI